MADYYPLLAKAVAGLEPNTSEARDGIYARARSALQRQLAGIDPPVAQTIVDRELAALEDVFVRIEAECANVPEKIRDTVPEETLVAPRPRPQLRKKIKPDGSDARKPMLAVALALATMVVFAIAVLAFLRRDQPPAVASGQPPVATSLPAPNNVTVPSKASDRVAPGATVAVEPTNPTPSSPASGSLLNEPASVPASGTAKPPAVVTPPSIVTPPANIPSSANVASQPPPRNPAPAPAIAVANRATLLLQGAAQTDEVLVRQGNVVWRRETVSGGQGEAPDQAIKAWIDIPEAKTTAELVLQRNRDAAFPASHTIQLRFIPATGSETAVVQSLTTFELRQVENQTGYALAGQGITVMDNVFLLALAQLEPTRARNEDMLQSRPLLYFEFVLAGGKRGAILLEKGISGQTAFEEAFRSWR